MNKIKGKSFDNPDYIIGSLDVSSLYTNITNDEGIETAREVLDRNRGKTAKPSTNSLIDLLRIVLTMNNFQFNGENFLQIGGTAMGTKVAPSYANLFMSNLEEKMLGSYDKQPTIWLRYIDNIFFIWFLSNGYL